MPENVSRETIYKNLLLKWQKSVNLVSPNTLGDVDVRHLADSKQLVKLIPQNSVLVDLGSGGGLPGIPLAIETGLKTFLVESDRKKSLFLEEVIRQTKIDAKVVNQRIEKAMLPKLEISNFTITARALAELKKLLDLINSFLENNNISSYKLILLKGRNAENEIIEARKFYEFAAEIFPSETDPAASILVIDQFRKL